MIRIIATNGLIMCALFTSQIAVSGANPIPASTGAGLTCVVAFGDSITRGYGIPAGDGWVELLSDLLKNEFGEKSFPVFNAGGNGNTSAEGLKRIDADVLARMPGLVLVEFGGNDAAHDARAVSVDEFERNLLAINEKVKSKGGEVVFMTFPPIINEWHSSRSNVYYENQGGYDKCVEQYRQRTREVAKRLGAPLFDLDQLLRKLIAANGRGAFINRDGVHLTPEANRRIAEAVFEFIKDSGKISVKN